LKRSARLLLNRPVVIVVLHYEAMIVMMDVGNGDCRVIMAEVFPG
jgi:hypothetical protein